MLKASIYATVGTAVLLCFVLTGRNEFLFWLGLAVTIASAFVVHYSSRTKFGYKLIGFFFWAAIAHAIFGYWAAENSLDAIWIGSNADQMFRTSLFVIGGTLLIAAFTYDVFPSFSFARFGLAAQRLELSEASLMIAARAFSVVGVLLIVYLAVTVGFMPILAPDPGQARYIFTELGSAYQRYDWIRLRALELLTCSLPLVLYAGFVSRKKFDVLIGILGVAAVLTTLQRGALISIFVVFILTIGAVQGRIPRKYFACLVLLGIGYFTSQVIYLNATGQAFDSTGAKTAVLSALPEVRDFGWVVSVAGDERFHGLTFVPPLMPIPGFATEFKQKYGLGFLTIRLMGLQEGLRITLPGEGYLNFGPLGVLIVGVLFGGMCALLSDFSNILLKEQCIACGYLVSMLFVWLCFLIYLGGTANAITVEYELIDILAMFIIAWPRRSEKRMASFPTRAH